MPLHSLYAVVGDDGVIADFFVSDCAVSSPDDVPVSVDRHLSPNTRYSVLAFPGTLTPVVDFDSASLPSEAPDDTAPPTPAKTSKSAK